MLTVWGRRSSSNVQAVMWCIGELNLAVNRIDAGFTYGHTNEPDYLAMNPNGKVPTLCDGSHPPVWESAAIIRYLAGKYSGDPFWPADHVERSRVDMWAEWSKLNIACEFTGPIFWQAVRTPAERRDTVALARAIEYLENNMRIADHQLGKTEFLAGSHFTLADIQFGHVLYRYFDIDIARSGELKNISRYYRSLVQRPEYEKHVMVSYDELIDSM